MSNQWKKAKFYKVLAAFAYLCAASVALIAPDMTDDVKSHSIHAGIIVMLIFSGLAMSNISDAMINYMKKQEHG